MGKNEEECREVYYAGLLHDVGKIGIKNAILTKNGKLTREEYEVIKQHALIGKQILSGITAYPYLSIAANFHHERYDGRGYPDKLKGEDIPEIARIITVADAYDAMSSNRSYRSAMPQQLVREEIVKGAGTQFDPEIARAMQHLIDMDEEYEMKERQEVRELAENILIHVSGFIVEQFGRIPLRKRIFRNPLVGQRIVVILDMDFRYHAHKSNSGAKLHNSPRIPKYVSRSFRTPPEFLSMPPFLFTNVNRFSFCTQLSTQGTFINISNCYSCFITN
jgi:hypothetical protein